LIESIHLTNFQCWKRLDLDLAPFVVILGQSGSGKTSVIRAVENMVQCKAGSEYITHGKSRSRIEMKVDGRTIGWVKGDGLNEYYMDSDRFQKVGRVVPNEVENLLNLPLYELEDEKFNLAIGMQFDAPFMVFDTPQRAARMVSLVSGVDKLLEISKTVSRDVRDEKASLDRLKFEKESLDSDSQFLEDLGLAVRWENLSGVVSEIQGLEALLADLQSREKFSPAGSSLEFPDVGGLRSVLDELARIPDIVEEPSPVIRVDEIDTLKLKEITDYLRDLEKMIETRDGFKETGEALVLEREVLQKEAIELGEVCPLCGSPVVWL